MLPLSSRLCYFVPLLCFCRPIKALLTVAEAVVVQMEIRRLRYVTWLLYAQLMEMRGVLAPQGLRRPHTAESWVSGTTSSHLFCDSSPPAHSFPNDEQPVAEPTEQPEDDDEEEDDEAIACPVEDDKLAKDPNLISQALQAQVKKVHVNLGHPLLQDFLRVLAVARAKPDIMRWTRNHFKCAQRQQAARPRWRRKGAVPRTYHFNRVVAADLFYLEVGDFTIPVLNVLDYRSGYQIVHVLDFMGGRAAEKVWAAFEKA